VPFNSITNAGTESWPRPDDLIITTRQGGYDRGPSASQLLVLSDPASQVLSLGFTLAGPRFHEDEGRDAGVVEESVEHAAFSRALALPAACPTEGAKTSTVGRDTGSVHVDVAPRESYPRWRA